MFSLDRALSGGVSTSSPLADLIGFVTPFAMFMLFAGAVALLFYYVTGENKRADKLMPKYLSNMLRVFSYFGLFVASLGLVNGAFQVMYFVLSNILPLNKGMEEAEPIVLAKGIALLVIFGIFAYASRMGKMKVDAWSKEHGDISTKIFLSIGMLAYSFVVVTSSIVFALQFVDFLFEDRVDGVDVMALSVLLAALPALAVFGNRTMEVLKKEGK